MNFEESLKYLISRQGKGSKGGLVAVRAALRRLGDPQKKFRSVHVTGTNGKGSVCALLECACRSAGMRTGLFVSPHILYFTERLQINGCRIPRDRFADLCGRAAVAGPELSFFELLTVMAFIYFAEENTDIAVIEAGIGGLLDSTNVLENPVLSIITSVSLDHRQQLGGTVREVAFQKAGIIKPGGVCLAPASVAPEAREEIEKAAAAAHAKAVFFSPCFDIHSHNWDKGDMILKHKSTGALFPYAIQGDAQVSNASLIWEAVQILSENGFRVSRADAVQSFRRVIWPCRFQIVHAGNNFNNAVFVLDGAHNPEAAAAFCRTWKNSPFCAGKPAYVMAVMKDKDRASVLRQLSVFDGRFYFTRTESERSAPPEELAKEFLMLKPGAQVSVFENPEDAIKKASENGTVAVIGSFYLAGAVLRLIKTAENNHLMTEE